MKIKVKIKRLLSLCLVVALVIGSTGQWSASAEEAEDPALNPTLTETAGAESSAPAQTETLDTEEMTFLRYIDEEQFLSANHIARLPDEERLDTYVFLNQDGTKTVYHMGRNVKFVDTDGSVVDKDTTLIATDGGYTMRCNDVQLLLPENASTGVFLALGDHGVRLVPQGGSGTAVVENNAVVFEDYYGEGMTLKYSPMLSGVKEDIILDSYTGTSSFSFGLMGYGLNLYERDGEWCLAPSETAQTVFTLGDVLVYDAIGRPVTGTMGVQEVRSGVYTVTVSAPVDFLTDPMTVYPVTVDPTLQVRDTSTQTQIEDAPVFSNYPNTSFGTYVLNTIGDAGETYGMARTAVRLTALLSDETYQGLTADEVVKAEFYIRDGGSYYTNVDIRAILGNSTWTESTATWSGLSTFSSAVYATSLMGGGEWECFDITSLVKAWKNGTQNAYCGFIMTIQDETTYVGTLSCEYGTGENWPYAVLTYEDGAVLNRIQIDIDEGATFTLTAENPNNLTLTWTSDDTSVATVSSTGTVTGVNAGTTTIRVSSADNSINASCIVYVKIPNGVYRIGRGDKYLGVTNAGIINGSHTELQTEVSYGIAELAQLWKIKYLGSGYYTVRPMHKLNMGLDVTSDTVDIWKIGTADTLAATGEYALWRIIRNGSGYVFINNSEVAEGTTMAMMPYGGMTAEGTSIINASYAPHYAFLYTWNLTLIGTVPIQALLYHNGTIKDSISVEFMPGQTRMLAQMSLDVAFVHPSVISQDVTEWQSSNSAIATVDDTTGAVTAISDGTVTITALFRLNGVTYSASYTVVVNLLPTSGYELDYSPTIWDDYVQFYTNCYAYVLNNQFDPLGTSFGCNYPGTNLQYAKQQPGELFETYCEPEEYINFDGYLSNESLLITAVQKDFEMYNRKFGTNLIFTEIGKYEVCPSGTYKVALYINANRSDYHWYRQDSDGYWSHKRGQDVVTRSNGANPSGLISDPDVAAENIGYTILVGYYAISAWNNIFDTSLFPSSVIIASTDQAQIQNTTIESLDELWTGMAIEEVVSCIGYAGNDVGSGTVVYEYTTIEGQTYYVCFLQDHAGVYRVAEIITEEDCDE